VLKLLAAVAFGLGDAAAGAGDFATAIAFYDRSIAVQPGNVEPHYNKGVVLYQSGRADGGCRRATSARWRSRRGSPPRTARSASLQQR
jgi:Flp pilus assembly protein TadD